MQKPLALFSFLILSATNLSFATNLNSMTKSQMEKAFLDKTVTASSIEFVDGKPVPNTFSMYMDSHGNITAKLAEKPKNEQQMDKGHYIIKEDGTLTVQWENWDKGTELCFHIYDTKNAYVSITCTGEFAMAYLKTSVQSNNHLK